MRSNDANAPHVCILFQLTTLYLEFVAWIVVKDKFVERGIMRHTMDDLGQRAKQKVMNSYEQSLAQSTVVYVASFSVMLSPIMIY